MAANLLERRLVALENFDEEQEEREDDAEEEEDHPGKNTKKKRGKKARNKNRAKGEEEQILDIVSGTGPLFELDFSGTSPEEELGDEGASRMRQALIGKSTSLIRLILRRANLGVGGFREVGRLVMKCPALEELVMSNNMAGPDALKGDFCEAIDDARSLKTLELLGVGLGDEGLDPLCAVFERFDEALRPMVGVTRLVLGSNNIGPAGAKRLATMLASNMKLQALDLADNYLREEGGRELAAGLIANKGRLSWLNASQNYLKIEGARPLFDVFFSKDAKWTIRLHRAPGAKHGFALDQRFVVTGFEYQGYVEKHNYEKRVDAVFIGDRIIDVNGKTSLEDMFHALTVDEVLDVTLTRDGICMEYLDICYNVLTCKGAEELRALAGLEMQGSLLGCQLRFDGGSRVMFLNAE
eukprot:TRINITY_DN18655_c0_g1_i1.p1 TRINITY_DN18655_c0_g1~~TRINITY_DN18655_c0_g1_i1.p1  ORF type:complete len:412 (-),score=104.02 TRINITY_DN18655_c0_g1_i1:74-1309(-)